MRWVRPVVHLIAKSQIVGSEARSWLKKVGVSDSRMSELLPDSVGVKTDAEQVIEMAGRRCYMSFELGLNPNVTKIRKDISEYIDNILKVGHGSICEHCSFTFAIENVSRVFTGEMNRHRAGCAISEGSMRFIRFDDIPIVEVPSLRVDYDPEFQNITPDFKQRKISREIIEATVVNIETAYKRLVDEVWKDALAPESKFGNKKNVTSMLRRIVPMGVATGGVWTLNLRALRHVCTMRCASGAEEEICEVAVMMLERMKEAEPNFFADFEKDQGGYWAPKYTKV